MTHKLKQSFVGSKLVLAMPMNRLQYNEYRGCTLPADENGADEGYLVEYTDGGAPNLAGHEGYVSWSPKAQFDGAYLSIGSVSMMQPHQQRVIAEKVALDDNLVKLGRALNGSKLKGQVSPEEFSRLCEQERVMREYSEILSARIAAFPVKP